MLLGFITVVVLVWCVSGLVAAGITFAHFQRKYPSVAAVGRAEDRALAYFMWMMGPMGLVGALLCGEGYGWLAPWSGSD